MSKRTSSNVDAMPAVITLVGNDTDDNDAHIGAGATETDGRDIVTDLKNNDVEGILEEPFSKLRENADGPLR